MTTLREARETGNLDKFIKEHKGEQGDPAAFNRVVQAMAQTSPATPKASSGGNRDD